MKKYLLAVLSITLCVASGKLFAQCPASAATPFDPSRGGATTNSGAFIFSQPGSLWVQDGGLDDEDGGVLDISGDVYINGDLRLTNNSSIVIQAGGRLFVYGNVYINSGSVLTTNAGGNLYFYGEEWINQPGAVINDNTGSGAINFIMPRPAPGAVDPISGSPRYPDNATAYTSVANTTQYIDGGGVNMNANINHYNANNLSLCNLDNSAAPGSGDLVLNGTINFSVAEGDVLLNDNNFILADAGDYSHNAINAYDGYFVTNGTGILSKSDINNTSAFTFPVGQDENDYTPVSVTNTSGAANTYRVQVKNYTNSVSTETVASEGIDRTWQIYAANAGTASICLQHNAVTNPAGAGTDGSLFDNTQAFVTQQVSDGLWSVAAQSDGSSPVSTHCASYTLPNSSADLTSYFTKSSDAISPLPVKLTSFRGELVNCTAKLTWVTATELNSDKYVLEHSSNGLDFVAGAEIASKNNPNGAAYEYTYGSPDPNINYFRLRVVDLDGTNEYSPVVQVRNSCAPGITITPNPVHDILTIRGVKAGSRITVINAAGAEIEHTSASSGNLTINAEKWNKGLYMIMVIEGNKVIRTEKVMKY